MPRIFAIKNAIKQAKRVMKILVTGSNGLLGQKISNVLGNNIDVEPIFSARNPLTYSINRGSFEVLDIANQENVNQVISSVKPDVIIHAAAMTQVDDCELKKDECWLQNTTATEYLIAASSRVGTHFIFVSTDFIFDGKSGPLDESAVPSPVNYYGESKLAAEEVVKKYRGAWSILRTVLVYGVAHDMSRSNIVLWVKKSLEEGKTINVVDDQWRTPTLAEDLALGCWLIAKKKKEGIFHISGEEMMSPYEIAVRTARFFSLDESLIRRTDSTQFKQPARRPLKTGFNIDKAKNELGYKPHTFEEGLSLLQKQLQ
jgi:dTDP-4-dehydrorhamnose reductase